MITALRTRNLRGLLTREGAKAMRHIEVLEIVLSNVIGKKILLRGLMMHAECRDAVVGVWEKPSCAPGEPDTLPILFIIDGH
jgi:hypothetical protein